MTTYTPTDLKGKNEAALGAIAEELGLSLNVETTNKNDLIAEILKAQEEDASDPVINTPAVLAEDLGIAVEAAKPVVEKKYKIIVSNQDGVDQTPFVKVQVNGYMYAIPREVEVVVPESVVEVLNNAIVTRYVQEGGEWVTRKGKRFPFNVIGRAR